MAACPSEQFVLELTGAVNLASIKNVQMPKMGFDILDPSVFHKMTNLKSMDLSDNNLREIPGDMSCKKLQSLDVSGNNLTSLEFVIQFPRLEKIQTDGNPLEPSDKFIAFALAPNLSQIDRMKRESADRTLDNVKNKLLPQVHEVWEKYFTKRYPKGIPESMEQEVTDKLYGHVKQIKIPACNYLKLNNFMKDLVVQELIESVQNGEYQSSPTKLTVSPAKHFHKSPTKPVHSTKIFSSPIRNVGFSAPDSQRQILSPKGSNNVTPGKTVSFYGNRESPRKRVAETAKRQILISQTEASENVSSPKKSPKISSPNKKVSTPRDDNSVMPVYSPRQSSRSTPSRFRVKPVNDDTRTIHSADKLDTPSKSPRQDTPSKQSKHNTPRKPTTPSKSDAQSSSKSCPGTPKTKTSREITPNKLDKVPSKSALCLPSLPDYSPVHFLRCHFNGHDEHAPNDPTDHKTQVWKCEFEPDAKGSGQMTNIVATCGGNTICLIDCNTGKVMQRYQEDKEIFYAVAWTTITMQSEERDWSTNILVAAGIAGRVKLIHPEQLVCYHEFVVPYEADINCLLFHPDYETILFCGAAEHGIISMHDIGVPSGDKYNTESRKLRTLKVPNNSPVINLIWSKNTNHLIAGCEDGCYVYKITNEHFKPGSVIHAVSEIKFPGKDSHVDSICLLSDDIAACKIKGEGKLYLWKLSETLKSKKDKIQVEELAALRYHLTDNYYLNMTGSDGVLASGDDEGRLWLYDVSKILKKKMSHTKDLLEPSRVLEWPECITTDKTEMESLMIDLQEKQDKLCVNSVVGSSNRRHLVAVMNNNMVCIWTCGEE